MKEETKEFWIEHWMTMAIYALTAILIFGKLYFGWSIGWFWCFAPIWIPFAMGLAGLFMMVFLCLSVFGFMLFFGAINIIIEELKGLG